MKMDSPFRDFSKPSAYAIYEGSTLARVFGHKSLEVLHLFYGLVQSTDSCISFLSGKYPFDASVVKQIVGAQYGLLTPHSEITIPFSADFVSVIRRAVEIKEISKEELVLTSHLFLAVVDEGLSDFPNEWKDVLLKCGSNFQAELLNPTTDGRVFPHTDVVMSNIEWLDWAVQFAQSEPLWRSVLAVRLAQKGLTVSDIEARLSP
ncbi:hypothetical protein KBI23_26835 [bacterium]|nr:hypothetical protein [bacterium]MBP9809332.1 hypothetical protein [bacterium]